MTGDVRLTGCLSLLLGAAAAIGILFGMQAARGILVPILLAAFLAIVCTGPMLWLRRRGVPNGLSIMIVLLGIFLLLGGVGALVGSSAAEFSSQLPVYQQRLHDDLGSIVGRLGKWGMPASSKDILDSVNPSAALGFASTVMSSLSSAMGNSVLIAFTLIFMLVEASFFPDKVRVAFGGSSSTKESLGRFQRSLNQYLGLMAVISAITGVIVTAFLLILGVDFALVFGLLAFLLNFVPNIGSVIAAAPAVLIAYLQLGPATALIVIVCYLAVNVVMGNIVQPRVMGEGMGLSSLVVFLSLVSWGWVLGTVGMLLSVPLTMSLKIALESSPETRKFAVLLGPKPEEESASA